MIPGSRRPQFPDDFFESLPEWSAGLCGELREIILSTVPEAREVVKWGCVCYDLKGLMCGIGAYQRHVTLQFMRGAELPDAEGIFNSGEGNVELRGLRFKPGEHNIPDSALRELLLCAADLQLSGKKRAAVRTPRPPAVVPADFAKLLAKSKPAAAQYAKSSPSCQREYIGWIEQAKRPETRQKRMLASVELLAAGRRVYEKRRE